MALAATPDQFRAVSKIFDHLQEQERTLDEQLGIARRQTEPARDATGTDVNAALAVLDRLAPLAAQPGNLGVVATLFTRLNARMFFRFAPVSWGKRTVNRVSGGVATFGATPPPISLYDGPTGRRALSGRPDMPPASGGIGGVQSPESQVPGREGTRSEMLVGLTGFEPATSWTRTKHPIQSPSTGWQPVASVKRRVHRVLSCPARVRDVVACS